MSSPASPSFFLQALDMDVDRALQHDRVLADGGIHELVPGERPAGLPDQDLQQAKLGRSQRELLVAIQRPVAVPVDHDPLALDHLAGGRLVLELPPPQLLLDPLDQDLHAVGLGHVVVRTGREAHQLVATPRPWPSP